MIIAEAYLGVVDAPYAVPYPDYDPNREPTAKPGRKGDKVAASANVFDYQAKSLESGLRRGAI